LSKRNNMNPDHYQDRGRDFTDTGVDYNAEKQQFGNTRPRRGKPAANFIPGAAPVGESGSETKKKEK
jgi:hypothetical protein